MRSNPDWVSCLGKNAFYINFSVAAPRFCCTVYSFRQVSVYLSYNLVSCWVPCIVCAALRSVRWGRFSPSDVSRRCVCVEGSCATRMPLRALARSRLRYAFVFLVSSVLAMIRSGSSVSRLSCLQGFHGYSRPGLGGVPA